MAVPFIQIGQCGNQIGSNFYSIMHDQGAKASPAHQALLSQFFKTGLDGKDKPKAFQIDMEPKVVNKNLTIKRNWQYDSKMSLVQQQGSGNNWAYGCKIHGPAIKEELSNILRRFAEEQDSIKCFVQMQSMAGGTGSGLGTFITQLLNEMFEKTPKFVVCVMPHQSGEVILQSYNACLSLGTIYQEVDGVFVIENDQINQICLKDLKIAKPSLEDINEVIGRTLASVFFPFVSRNITKIWSVEQNGFNYGLDLIQSLFYDSRYKLCSIRTSPHGPKDSQSFNGDSWQAVESELFRKKTKAFSSLLLLRGPDHPCSQRGDMRCLQDRHGFYGYNRSATWLQNGASLVDAVDKLLERGYRMLKEEAYVYQYQKFGLDRGEMLDSFAVLEGVQTSYRRI